VVTPRLSASDLHHAYGDRPTLRGIDVRVAPGERLALLGANGAGKTTLLYHLNGLIVPSAGAVALDGEPVSHDGHGQRRWRRAVGLLFQNPDDQLFGPTVLDDVALGPVNLGEPPARARVLARQSLVAMGLEHLAAEPVHALSLGERKGVALAGVLVMNPSVLLLDEPTQGLDARTEQAFLDALQRATACGVGIIMATHDVDLVCRWADRVVVLRAGRVLDTGTPDEALTAATLEAASLRRPWVFDVARELQRLGVLPVTARLPTSGAELTARLACLDPARRRLAVSGAGR